MRSLGLPRNVVLKTAKGRDYYYFIHPEADERGCAQYIRLPDIHAADFQQALANLRKKHPRVAKSHRRTSWARQRPCVYFVGGETGLVKIGHTVRLKSRLISLRVASPIPVMVLATVDGGIEQEAEYHRRFAHLRVRGEWFERAPELQAEIDRLRSENK